MSGIVRSARRLGAVPHALLIHPYNIDVLASCIEEGRSLGEECVDLILDTTCYNMHLTNMAERVNAAYALSILRDP